MSKLSTDKLKTMISEWLSKPEYRSKIIDDDFDPNEWVDRDKTITMMEQKREDWEAPPSINTPQLLGEYIWKLWCDGSQWKRVEKQMLKKGWVDYLACDTTWEGFRDNIKYTYVAGFPIDVIGIGDSNEDLVKKLFDDPKQAKKCILRMFQPNNQLADNYRLEVVTTPNDDEVVGWTVIVD